MARLVIVFGSSRTHAPDYLEEAESLGRLLAMAGYAVGSGGYAAVMEAVSKGAFKAGGHVIGYTCDQFPDAIPNRWIHEERRTANLHQRIEKMLAEGDAFVASWGGIGTLAEVAMAWNAAQAAPFRDAPVKPLVLLGAHWPPLLESIREHTEIGQSVLALPLLAATAQDVVTSIDKTLSLPSGRSR
ncbi:MAG: LOG family protein [Anaerolineae bacterium]|nr:LOG family protein [Anaerolineae bacterium]